MAFCLINLAYRVRGVGGPAKAVLVRMADVARDDGSDVRISVQRLSDEVEFSIRTVQQAIARLRDAGILVLTAEEDAGAKRPRIYRLNVELMASIADAAEAARVASGVQVLHPSEPPFGITGASPAGVGVQDMHPSTDTSAFTGEPAAPVGVRELHPQPDSPTIEAAADDSRAAPQDQHRRISDTPASPAPVSQLDVLLDAVGVDVSTHAGWWFAQNALGKWIASGCDFDLDVLPAVRAVMARRKGAVPHTPDYFTPAVIDAMRRRLAPLPLPPQEPTDGPSRPTAGAARRPNPHDDHALRAGVAAWLAEDLAP